MVKDKSAKIKTFDDYIHNGSFCFNYPKYTDLKGNLIVDEVIKYETLMEDLGQIFHNLSIPFDGSLGVRAKSQHRKDRRPYQEIYSDDQREIIARAFQKEIEMHGYTF